MVFNLQTRDTFDHFKPSIFVCELMYMNSSANKWQIKEFYKIIQNWDKQYASSLSDSFYESCNRILVICKGHICDIELITDKINHKAAEKQKKKISKNLLGKQQWAMFLLIKNV